MNACERAAREYARLGLLVVPLHWPNADGACSCGCGHPACWRRAKHPLLNLREASANPEVIAGWWQRWPKANVGIVAWGLTIVDIDPAPGRESLVQEFFARWNCSLDENVAVHTGGGGVHVYFSGESGRFGRGKDRLGAGLDVQSGARGFVVAPPSQHSSMSLYEWAEGASPAERPFVTLPAELEAELAGRPPVRWLIHVAPYWLAGRLHLSVEARLRIRKLLRQPVR